MGIIYPLSDRIRSLVLLFSRDYNGKKNKWKEVAIAARATWNSYATAIRHPNYGFCVDLETGKVFAVAPKKEHEIRVNIISYCLNQLGPAYNPTARDDDAARERFEEAVRGAIAGSEEMFNNIGHSQSGNTVALDRLMGVYDNAVSSATPQKEFTRNVVRTIDNLF